MKIKKLLLQVILAMTVRHAPSQGTCQIGTSLYISPGTYVYTNNLNILSVTMEDLQNHGTIIIASPTMSTFWTDSSGGTGGMNLLSTGLVRVIGPNTLYVDGSTATQHFNLDIDDPGGVILNRDVIVRGTLKFFQGIITTNSNEVISSNSASGVIVADATNPLYSQSWVNGNLRRFIASGLTGAYDFPVGTATTSNLLILDDNNLSGGGFNYLDASFETPKPGNDVGLTAYHPSEGNYTQVLNYGVWHLNPNTTLTSGSFNLKLYFNGFSGLVDNAFAPLVRINNSSNAADWYVPLPSTINPTGTPGRIISSGYSARNNIPYTDFGQWGIGEANSPLPIELASFSAEHISPVNYVYWVTATEDNVDYFVVEKSVDAKNFEGFAKCHGAGSSTSTTNYKVIDSNPSRTTYYRLKTVDNNGKYIYEKNIIVCKIRYLYKEDFKPKFAYDAAGRQINQGTGIPFDLSKKHK